MCSCGIKYNRAAVPTQEQRATVVAQKTTPAVESNTQRAVAPVIRPTGRGGYRLPKKLV